MYTLSPFFGPVLGPLISGFICQVCIISQYSRSFYNACTKNTDWRWAYRVCLIYEFATLVSLLLVCLFHIHKMYCELMYSPASQFVPETYVPVLLKRKAARLRKETGNEKYWAPLDRPEGSILHAMLFSISTPFSECDTNPPISTDADKCSKN